MKRNLKLVHVLLHPTLFTAERCALCIMTADLHTTLPKDKKEKKSKKAKEAKQDGEDVVGGVYVWASNSHARLLRVGRTADEVAVEKKSKKDKKKKKEKIDEEAMVVDLPGASIAYVRSASRVDGCSSS